MVEGFGTAFFDYADYDRLDICENLGGWNTQRADAGSEQPLIPHLVSLGLLSSRMHLAIDLDG